MPAESMTTSVDEETKRDISSPNAKAQSTDTGDKHLHRLTVATTRIISMLHYTQIGQKVLIARNKYG